MDYKLETHVHQLREGVGEQSDVFKLSLFNWTTLTDGVVQDTTFHKAQLPVEDCTFLLKMDMKLVKRRCLGCGKCI